jgi:hypothetical protein
MVLIAATCRAVFFFWSLLARMAPHCGSYEDECDNWVREEIRYSDIR